jgi:hypothetical protein
VDNTNANWVSLTTDLLKLMLRRRAKSHFASLQPNALVQLQAQYHHCGEAAFGKCLAAATFVSAQAAINPEAR